MKDQAEGLRNLVNARRPDRSGTTRTITVTSGKGGVGKSNFTLNFALSLQSRGYRVLIFDADIGFSNIEVLMGATPRYNLYDLINGSRSLSEIICRGYNGLEFISGGSGFSDLQRLSDDQLERFVHEVEQLNGTVDYVLFDTGAGLSKESIKYIVSANETVIVTTPEPTALTDAYAIIKMLHGMNYRIDFQLVVNRAQSMKEGRQTAEKIGLVTKQFLDMDLPTLGILMDDPFVSKAVRKQVPFKAAYPSSDASRCMERLTDRYLAGRRTGGTEEAPGVKGFLNKMIQMLK